MELIAKYSIILNIILVLFIILFFVRDPRNYRTDNYDYQLTESFIEKSENFWSGNEYAGCVDGRVVDSNTIMFENITNIIIGTSTKSILPNCDGFGVIHSHPQVKCDDKLNAIDTEAAKKMFKNGVTFFIIQCKKNSFEIYTKKDLYNGEVIEII